jgi:hypothetical protein
MCTVEAASEALEPVAASDGGATAESSARRQAFRSFAPALRPRKRLGQVRPCQAADGGGAPRLWHSAFERSGASSARTLHIEVSPSDADPRKSFRGARRPSSRLDAQLFLGALVILYVTNFYTVAADRLAPISVHGDGDAGSPPSLAPQQRAAYAAAAVRPPGSAVSSSAAFEAHDPPRGRSAMNTLPGAIGLNGPFDSSSEAPAAPASSPGDAGGSGSTAAAASADQAAVIISAKPPSEEAPTDASTPSAAAPSGDAAVDVERGTTATTTAAVIEAAQATPPQAAASPPETAVAGEAAAASAAGASSESETAADAGSAEAGDDPNVIRDGLGHVIPQKKKKRKRRRRRASVTGRGESGPAGDEPAAGPAAASSPASEAEGSSSAGGARPPPAEELSSMSMPPVDVGDHPMSGRLTELQVDAETGPLDATAVKKTYRKLVKAYLAPFKGGIKRRAFFDVLRRKNYSLAPPESNKGIQTILLQVISKSWSPRPASLSPRRAPLALSAGLTECPLRFRDAQRST